MALILTDVQRFSNVIKSEFDPSSGFTREAVTVYESGAKTYVPGVVVGKTLTSGSATETHAGNTGNGAMGTITVGGRAQIGNYTLVIAKAASNAGDFYVTDPKGRVIGTGSVAVAFSGGGLSFTLADGSTDFIVGDTFIIAVTGTYQYKMVEATATDGTEVAAGIFVEDQTGKSGSTAIAATTATPVLILARGPAIVSDLALVYGTSVNTAALKANLYNQLAALNILTSPQV